MADFTHFSIKMQPETRPIWKSRKNSIEYRGGGGGGGGGGK